MTFKPRIWYPIAVLLSLGNVVSVWFAAVPAEPVHATVHAALAVAFGVWAMHLRQGRDTSERQSRIDALGELEEFEREASRMRQELTEAQDRLASAERMLKQQPGAR